VIAREDDVRRRSQRVHHREHVDRPQLRLDERGQVSPHRDRVAVPDVIVVEEEHEEPHVVSARLPFFVARTADPRDPLLGGHRRPFDADGPELFDLLGLAVLDQLEIGLLEVGDRPAVPIADERIDADEVDFTAEGRGLRRLRGGLLTRAAVLGRAALRGLLRRRCRLHLACAEGPSEKKGEHDTNHGLIAPPCPR
jgi:hypothetical protein